jgi:hypothetical protein
MSDDFHYLDSMIQSLNQDTQETLNNELSQGQSLQDILNQQIQPSTLQSLQHQSSLQLMQQQPLYLNDDPLFVNAKQYHRILKRREARQRYEQLQKQKYLHLSRHLHAKKRPRGPGGRFLSSAELEALKATNRLVDGVILQRPVGPVNEYDTVLEKLDNELRQLNK